MSRPDVVIIGGGAIGCAAAYFLRTLDPGIAVTVVERDPRYTLASTPRASGGVRRQFSLPENIELSQFSIPFFEAFPESMVVGTDPVDIGFKRNGYLLIVPPDGVSTLRRNYETQARLGVRVEWLEPPDLRDRWPSMLVDDLGAGVFSPDDGWLDPHSMLMALRARTAHLGATFVTDEVTGLERRGGIVTAVELASGLRLTPDHVVLAAGAWAKDVCAMLGETVPVEPMKRYEHYFEPQDPIEPLPYIKDVKRLAFRPEGNGYSGGVPSWDQPRGYDFAVDPTYFERAVWPALAERFPQFDRTACHATLSGLYDQNDFDASPIIGPGLGGLSNFHLLAGFSGHGLMHAPGAGRAIAELVIDGRYGSIDLTRFGPQRLVEDRPIRETGIV